MIALLTSLMYMRVIFSNILLHICHFLLKSLGFFLRDSPICSEKVISISSENLLIRWKHFDNEVPPLKTISGLLFANSFKIMKNEKVKVYTYTRVSTAMQIDGYSLDAQKSRMKAFADYNDYEIVHEYQDAGKSGRSIEGRARFMQMMDDIKTEKDGVCHQLLPDASSDRCGRSFQ